MRRLGTASTLHPIDSKAPEFGGDLSEIRSFTMLDDGVR